MTGSESGGDRMESARRQLHDAQVGAQAAWDRLGASRSRRPLTDVLLSLYERDREILGTMLSGAVAFRMFVWLVPYTLVLVTLLGIFADTSGDKGGTFFAHLGLGGELAEALQGTTREHWTNRVWALLIGIMGSLWTAKGLVRALRATHAAAWGAEAVHTRGGLARASVGLVATVSAIITALGVAAWLRWATPVGGLITTLAVVVVMLVAWLAVSRRMPHPRRLPARALLPGAILVAAGMQVLHLVTAYYLLDYANRAESLYGTIGTAVVLLLWLFIIARLFVTSATLNAVLWEHEQAGKPGLRILGFRLFGGAPGGRSSHPDTAVRQRTDRPPDR